MSRKVYTCDVWVVQHELPDNATMKNETKLISDENCEVWREYLEGVVRPLITRETMETPEFKAAAERVRKAKGCQHRASQKKKVREMICLPKIAYVPDCDPEGYEVAYAEYILKVVSYEPMNKEQFFAVLRALERWARRSVPALVEAGNLEAAYALALSLCKHLPLLWNRDDFISLFLDVYKSRYGKLVKDAFAALRRVASLMGAERMAQVEDFALSQRSEYAEFGNVF